jgi:hypothetical protein
MLMSLIAVLLAGLGHLTSQKGREVDIRRDIEVVLIVRDSASKELIRGALIVIKDNLCPFDGVREVSIVHLVTNDDGRAVWRRNNSLIKDVIRPWCETTTYFICLKNCSLDVRAQDYLPIENEQFRGLAWDNEKGDIGEGGCQRLEFAFDLQKVNKEW